MSEEKKTGDGFDDWLPVSAKRIAPGEYEVVDKDGRRLWYMEGAALAEWVCSTLNSAAVLKAAARGWRVKREAAYKSCGKAFDEQEKAFDEFWEVTLALHAAADEWLKAEG